MTPENSRILCSAPSKCTYITRLITGIKNSLEVLGAQASTYQLEQWAIFIHESMSISSRNYHSVKHVFDLTEGQEDPILVLAAFFHDCIYYQVDGGLSPCQESIVQDVIREDGSTIYLNPDTTPESDVLLSMMMAIFGFQAGQSVSLFGGLNEFLSAVVAVRELEPVLDRTSLAQIACCIEVTIPFRPPDQDGITATEHLYRRMLITNDRFDLGLSESQLLEAVQRAVRLGNLDIGNFGTTDRAWFLDNTWSLLPETNVSLRSQNLYTVQDFQHAVYKLNGFFSYLDPSLIFSEFRGVPSAEECRRLSTEAARNVKIGRTYVRAKLLGVSVLAAFAILTGGDAPICLFLGDLTSRKHASRRLMDALPPPPAHHLERLCDADVYDILVNGRRQETSFDVRQSPLAAFLYGWMGDEAVDKVIRECTLYPMGADDAKILLTKLPRQVVTRVAQNMARVAVTRADAIRAILEDLPQVHEDEDYLDGAMDGAA